MPETECLLLSVRESYFSRTESFLPWLGGALGGPVTPSSFLLLAVVLLEKKF